MTRLFLALSAAAIFAAPVHAETRLLMFEQPGCVYCAAWHDEVGPGYPHSTEGKAAPLMILPLRGALPEGIILSSKPVLTPTFVLVVDGQETGRLEGYVGAHFFWPMLAELLRDVAE